MTEENGIELKPTDTDETSDPDTSIQNDWFYDTEDLKRWDSNINYYADSMMSITDLPRSSTLFRERSRSEMYLQRGKLASDLSLDSIFDPRNFPWNDMELPGTWGQHGVEKYPWSDNDRPLIKIDKYVDFVPTEEERAGLLTERIIAACSTYLERSPEIGHMALVKCQLQKKGLRDITELKYYHYLQYLDIANNRINDLSALGQLPFLMYLDASCNELSSVLGFKAPFNLTYVNLSHNLIDEIDDLCAFWSIVYLDLSYNMIFEIKGLSELRYLRHLNLSYNEIERLENLDNMMLQTLHLQHNCISKFSEGDYLGVKTMQKLSFIDLSCNKLKSLRLFFEAFSLEEIDMSGNFIDSLYELHYLVHLHRILKIDFTDNPISVMDDYYNACLYFIPSLCVLDNNFIDPEEKVQARAKFNEYAPLHEARLNTRLTLLRNLHNEYVDDSVVPVAQPPPPVIILVGLPASKKGKLVREFCSRYPKHTKIGVSHTTRNKWQEVEGEAYYFIPKENFIIKLKNGEFLVVHEFLGNSYGLAQAELAKVIGQKSVLVLHMDITSALLLRRKGLRPRLVLALPSSPHIHEEWLKEKYTYSSYQPLQKLGGLLIENNPYIQQQRDLINSMQMRQNKQLVRGLVEEIVDQAIPSDTLDSAESSKRPSESSVEYDDVMMLMAPKDRSILKRRRKSSGKSLQGGIDFFNIQSVRSVTFKVDGSWEAFQDEVGFTSVSETLLGSASANLGQLSVLSSAVLQDSDSTTKHKVVHKDEEKEDTTHLKSFYYDKNKATNILFDDIIKSRERYFEAHRDNPGLFCDVIETDRVEDSIKKLKHIMKECIKNYKDTPPFYNFPKGSAYENMIYIRLKQYLNDMNRVLGQSGKETDCNLYKYQLSDDLPHDIIKMAETYQMSQSINDGLAFHRNESFELLDE